MYDYWIDTKLQKIMTKLLKKDPLTRKRIIKKINEIVNSYDVEHYKNLQHDLKEFKRVHVAEKVLVFKFDRRENKIIFFDFDHHDKIYLKRF